MPQALIHCLPAGAPDDLSAFDHAVSTGLIDASAIIAVIGKTEGNGCVNDFSRGLATHAWSKRLCGDAGLPVLVMSGGCEGGIAPHWLVIEARDADGPAGPALAVAVTATRALEPFEIGTEVQTELVAQALGECIVKADIENVHFVQIKCPLLTAERSAVSTKAVMTTDTLKSMGLSRGAASLGVARVLGEQGWSAVASASAGIELMTNEIVVMGMSAKWSGNLQIDHAVMGDAFDIEPVRTALSRLGIQAQGQLTTEQRRSIKAVLAKADPSPDGRIRGWRHTMLDDSDISATRHARALVGGVIGGVIGDGALFVSGGAEHQGPPGGGPVAIIAERGV